MECSTWNIAITLCAALTLVSTVPLAPITKAVNEYRLPQDVIPLEYEIELDPLLDSVDNPEYFDGKVVIKVKIVTETANIVLNIRDLTIIETDITRVKDGIQIEHAALNIPEYEFYILSNLEEYFEEEEEYSITIRYQGKHFDDMDGFYRSSYMEDGKKKWLVTTQFQATSARRAFPCFDEPALKATFKISISKKSGLNAISNMELDTEDADWFHFKTTPLMSTYLIAFIVSEFESKTVDGFLNVWARKQAIEQAQYSAEIGTPIIRAMENFLMDNKYTLSKMDEVAVPDFSAGAMENWGICTYRERLILFDASASSADHKQRIAAVVAHEFAHQWFGDLVSPEWWNYLWLNEGFATYFESHATDLVETTWRMKEQFVVRDVQGALAADATESTHPMTIDVTSPSSIDSIFDSIAYEKAGSVIRMMEHFVTTEVFKRGLNKYLSARQYSYANEDNLYDAISEEFAASLPEKYQDVQSVMHTWTRQAGYPVITIISSELNIVITQKRFVFGKPVRAVADTIWNIPLTYVAQDGDFTDTSTKEWMLTQSIIINRPASPNQWYIMNVQEAGFYRVNYDIENWKLLINYLDSDDFVNIHPVNRAQLIDDALSLARAGELDYDTALSVTRYLHREVDFIPWYSALTNLAYLKRRLTGTANYENFKSYVLKLIDNIYNELGFEHSDDHPHITKLHRSLILQWACDLDHEHCVQSSKDKFNSLRERSENVPADLQSVVFCTVVRNGGSVEWSELWDLYLSTNVATQQTLVLTALGCTTDQALIDDLLVKSITEDGDIRRQDASSVFSAVYSNSAGVELALDFLERNLEDIKTFYGGGVSSIISAIATRISTLDLIERLHNFVSTAELGSAQAAAERAIQAAKDNLYWMEHYESTIGPWLENELTTGATTESTTPSTESPTTPSTESQTTPSTVLPTTVTAPPTIPSTAPPTAPPTTESSATHITFNPFVSLIFLVNIIHTYLKYQN